MQSYPGPAYRPLPRWRRVVCPPGVLPAACLAGFTGAALIPLDRPGIGWLLTGSVAVGAIYLVDRNARKSAQNDDEALDANDGEWSATSETAASAAGETAVPGPEETAALDPAASATPTSSAATSNPGGEDSTSSAKSFHDSAFREEAPGVANTQPGKFDNAKESTAASERAERNPKPDPLVLDSDAERTTLAD
ncbi:hypothetical protein ABZ942_33050, partial [Nocardia sp. NPDC046473]